MKIYLSGPIDFADDRGIAWRDVWTKSLIDIGFLKKDILNPCRKPKGSSKLNLNKEAQLMTECRANKDWDGLMRLMDEIVRIDLKMCDDADIVVVNFPKTQDGKSQIPTYGTMHEIVLSEQSKHQAKIKKHIYVVWEGGKNDCSAWLMWLVGHNNVFSTFDELLLELKRIINLPVNCFV